MVRAASQFQSKDPTAFVIAGGADPITLDPALAYDTDSGEVIQNLYETLVFYDAEKTDAFVPQLAESWEISTDGTTYTFHIRQGVKFHEGEELTPSDVAYSFQRGLLQGGTTSPQWLLTIPFFGIGIDDISLLVDPNGNLYDKREALSKANPETLVAACQKVKDAIVADDASGTVTMTLSQPWSPFLSIIAQTWGSIMDKDWVAKNGGWDGSCDTWQKFYAMKSSQDPFTKIANGTGPFKLDNWWKGHEVVMVRNEDYWREPAKLERVTMKFDTSGSTRIAMMQTGEADTAVIGSSDRSELDGLVGERCEYDIVTNVYKPCEVIDEGQPFVVFTGRPSLSQDVLLFNYDLSRGNGKPYIGSGKLDGKGIPTDFFADTHVRRAFAYCFDWDTLIKDAYDSNAIQSLQLLMPGMPGFNPDAPHYSNDLAKCEEEFKLADVDKDGVPAGTDPDDVWETGFQFQAVYNQGNSTRQAIAEILSSNLATVNEKFVVKPVELSSSNYSNALHAGQIPIMTAGWLEDIHDPDNWFQPYTVGFYSGRQALPDDIKAQFQELLNKGLAERDPAKRDEIYRQASQLYYDQAIGLPLVRVSTQYYYQRWVQGLVLNPIFPGLYFYPIYKE
jgi:peptide/nickel transport system substrate-binding protein